MPYWRAVDAKVEGASQRIQEDAMNFAKIVESSRLDWEKTRPEHRKCRHSMGFGERKRFGGYFRRAKRFSRRRSSKVIPIYARRGR